MTHDQMIRDLGGYRRLARQFDMDVSSTFKWLVRGIPASRWCDVVDLARADGLSGITMDVLARSRPERGQVGRSRQPTVVGRPGPAPREAA